MTKAEQAAKRPQGRPRTKQPPPVVPDAFQQHAAPVFEAIREGIWQPKEIDILDWFQRYLVPPDGDFKSLRWQLEKTPYAAEILEELNPLSGNHEVAIRKSAQTGLSQLATGWLAALADLMPSPMMYTLSKKDVSEMFMNRKLRPVFQAAEPLRERVRQQQETGNRSVKNESVLSIGAGASVQMAHATVADSVTSWTVRFAVADEIAKWKANKSGDPLALLKDRMKSYHSSGIYMILEMSTPENLSDDRINKIFMAGDQRFWNVPCPHCGEYQKLEFGTRETDYGLKWSKDGSSINVWYQCRLNGCIITEEQKPSMIQAGCWIKENESGFYPSFHIDSLSSLLASWQELVKGWLKIAPGDIQSLKTFLNSELGLPFDDLVKETEAEQLARRAGDLQPILHNVKIVTAGIDVQANGVYFEVVGWDNRKRSYSLAWDFLPGDTTQPAGTVWERLAGVLRQRYAGHPVCSAFVDSRYSTEQVAQFCGQLPNAQPIRGEGGRHFKQVFEKAKPIKFVDRSGKWSQIVVFSLAVDFLKDQVANHLAIDGMAEGQPENPDFYCFFGIHNDGNYFQMMTAETKVARKRAGQTTMVWEAQHKNNHIWDCRIYATAAAHYAQIFHAKQPGDIDKLAKMVDDSPVFQPE